MKNSSTRVAKQAENAERRALAIKLKIMGATYDQIAAECGYYDRSAARKDVKRALKDLCPIEDRLTLRRIEKARITRLLLAAMPKALANDWKAHAVVRGYSQDLRELLGLDDKQPTKITGPNGGPILTADVTSLTDEQLERLAAGDFSAVAGEGGT